MAVTASDIQTCFAEFGALSVATIDKFIQQAENRINRKQWGLSKADDGVLYLTAHLLKLAELGDGLAAGAMSGKTVNKVSAQYAIPDHFKKSSLAATAYGRYFLDLQRLVFPCRKI